MFLSRKLEVGVVLRARNKGFNGAGMFLSRKCDPISLAQGRQEASMGPGCFYPGNEDGEGTGFRIFRLQWGRDVSIPEIPARYLRQPTKSGFNGAGMFLSRKFSPGLAVSRV